MAQQERFHDLPLEEVIGDRFGRYSKYIIQDRALPDARDGLKNLYKEEFYMRCMQKEIRRIKTSVKPLKQLVT
ncbi:hypothetical protein BsIDN1_33640 [Bacillus safensis]|uniref:Uncharacterized protein n=1 Tax=Bacillus safensis TaxID=561879 RepID=A0A5S9MDX5_BACIA|nr:hypothetical protein BsIDN1_33640 [Bacillus safensis]